MPKKNPHCHSCRFYFITHDASLPYGCHAFEFKSKRLPSQVVRENSGEDCVAYSPRPPRRGAAPSR